MFAGGLAAPELFGGRRERGKTTTSGTGWVGTRGVRLGEIRMSEKRCSVRVAGLALAGAVSVTLALLIAERIVRPGVISEVRTPMLLGLVMLFVLPALTFFAARQDERTAIAESVAKRSASRRRTPEPVAPGRLAERAEDPVPASADADEADSARRSIRHGAHARVQPVPTHRGTAKAPASHAE